jgi:NAD(P)-dependent dehydrogenase (short-subunit alcohol dehydrogenase family)
VVVLADRFGLARRVVRALGDRGVDTITVSLGESYHPPGPTSATVRADRTDDYLHLLRDLTTAAGRRPDAIVSLVDVAPPADDLGTRPSIERVTALALALGEHGAPVRLHVAVSGTQQVAAEGVPSPRRAVVYGPSLVAPSEYPHVMSRVVDVPTPGGSAWAADLIADQIADEALGEIDQRLVAYRGPQRFVRSLRARPVPTAVRPVWRPRGVYLITGAFGGLGRTFARQLAREVQARLVLMSRTELPPRDVWDGWVLRHGRHHHASHAIALLQDIERAGGEALVVRGDVASPADVSRAVGDARRRFGGINGVIHAAGVLDDALMAVRDPARVTAVLAPKIEGTEVLAAAVADEPLDALVLCSSVSAFAGLAGQSDYAAANAFLDAFAQHRQTGEGKRTVSIGWAAWREVGMTASWAEAEGWADAEPVDHPMLRSMRRVDGDEVFEGTLDPRRDWVVDEHRLRRGQALLPGAGFLELARAAFAHSRRVAGVEIGDALFLRPLAVGDDEERTFTVALSTTPAGPSFTVASRDSADAPWIEHAQGTLRAVGERPGRVDLTAIRARCVDRAEDVSGPVNQEHLRFGPHWDCLRHVAYGCHEALASLAIADAFAGELPVFPLHPALVDVATAGVQGIVPDHDPASGLFVPVSFRRVSVFAPLPPAIVSHVRYRGGRDDGADFASFDVALLSPDGDVLVQVEDFVMKRIDPSRLAMAEPAPPARRRVTNAPPPVIAALGEAIAPAEGMDALTRTLSALPWPYVVISPHEIAAWSRFVRTPAPRAHGGQAADAPEQPRLHRVEDILRRHPAVEDVVVCKFVDGGGLKRVVAYFTSRRGETTTASDLRRHVRASGEVELVPTQFFEQATMPRTRDGRIDRAQFANPFATRALSAPPATATGQAIAAIWKDLLGVEHVGGRDNFFDIGGHSLLAVQGIARIQRTLGITLRHADLVVNTVDQLAARCESLLAKP